MTEPTVFSAAQFPIVRVTCFEDRSEIVRRGDVSLVPGTNHIVLTGLSALVDATRTQASSTALQFFLENVGLAPFVNRARPQKDEQLEQRRRERDRRAFALKVLQQRLDDKNKGLGNARETMRQALVRLGECLFVQSPAESDMRALIQKLEADIRRRDDDVAALRKQIQAALKSLHEVEALSAPAPKRRGTWTDIDIALWSEGAQSGPLEVKYVVPCAVWRPRHEASLADEQLHWTTGGSVWQRTGEDWTDVELVLSTARPSAGAQVPKLSPDRLSYRLKTKEERKTIRVQHRMASAQKDTPDDVAPGVYDGGQSREFKVPEKVTIPSDGRPRPVVLGRQDLVVATRRVARPTLSAQVFMLAETKNAFSHPLLAGPVTLSLDGSYIGVGDIPYVGAGEGFSLPFGSDDRFGVALSRYVREEKRTLGKNRDHFVQEVDVVFDGDKATAVDVEFLVPVSELAQLKVRRCDEHSTSEWSPDDNGHVKLSCRLEPGAKETLKVAFYFDAGSGVQIPNPW